MPWKPGESGNPLGRPRGSKNRFSEIKEGFTEAFERMGGVEGLVEWIQAQPKNQGDFYRILAGMMPRDLTIEATDTRRSAIEYSTGELIALLGETDEEADEPNSASTGPVSSTTDGEGISVKTSLGSSLNASNSPVLYSMALR